MAMETINSLIPPVRIAQSCALLNSYLSNSSPVVARAATAAGILRYHGALNLLPILHR